MSKFFLSVIYNEISERKIVENNFSPLALCLRCDCTANQLRVNKYIKFHCDKNGKLEANRYSKKRAELIAKKAF